MKNWKSLSCSPNIDSLTYSVTCTHSHRHKHLHTRSHIFTQAPHEQTTKLILFFSASLLMIFFSFVYLLFAKKYGLTSILNLISPDVRFSILFKCSKCNTHNVQKHKTIISCMKFILYLICIGCFAFSSLYIPFRISFGFFFLFFFGEKLIHYSFLFLQFSSSSSFFMVRSFHVFSVNECICIDEKLLLSLHNHQ